MLNQVVRVSLQSRYYIISLTTPESDLRGPTRQKTSGHPAWIMEPVNLRRKPNQHFLHSTTEHQRGPKGPKHKQPALLVQELCLGEASHSSKFSSTYDSHCFHSSDRESEDSSCSFLSQSSHQDDIAPPGPHDQRPSTGIWKKEEARARLDSE